ncbi:flagellar assembly peptidoglycan hydrolase FlgJ [Lysobacter sp. TY2-98]|uniref:flagellar assembly peptidoglycan hydrolase FlgJ n=1 Tax=Lysobacter sp. TY2-98 TaxID=2290922 RepID=UPI000E205AAC|nr:flagellar assembly peptidoglycan hydrolase FlgJ [Lysobacter sp. TY2-98]AXK71290.1 flagellar assembly peptidoglycan hydrolase FlgJ [Lysobacter sp. TY2-98]
MRLQTAIALDHAQTASTSRPAMEKAAHELETQFASMLIKSMRGTSSGDPLAGGDTTYREMYDNQLAKELSKGRGLGLAPMIMKQLERSTGQSSTPAVQGPLPLVRPAGSSIPLSAPSGLAPMKLGESLQLAPSSSGVSMNTLSAPTTPVPAPTASASTDACGPLTPMDCSSPEAFVKSLWPHAKKVAQELGVSAKALIAQAALETGWGRKLVGGNGNVSHNLFGIKAGGGWSGKSVASATHEYVDGVRQSQRANFRSYSTPADSFSDYARLLGGGRYANARGTGEDAHAFASALQHAGYATDPSYANKITAIANGATMRRALAALGSA